MQTGSFNGGMIANSSGKSFPKEVEEAAETHRKNNTLTEDAACASYIRYQAREGDPQTNWNWQRLWLKHCLSPRTEFLFHKIKSNGEKVNREDDINEILESDFLRSDNLSESERQYFQQSIADWFLRRYNWKDAYSARYSVPRGRAKNYYFAGFAIVIILLVFLTVALASGHCFQILHSLPWPQLIFWTIIGLVAGGICAMLLAGWSRFLFIRLLATILVGLVPVVVESPLWKLAVEMEWPMLAVVSAVTFAVGLAYCSADCARVTSLGRLRALGRALPVALYGILFAFVIAIVISYVMGASMVDSIKAEPIVSYPGLYGTFYPAAVFLFAPVSLFIGLFIYSFWQQRTVTDPF